MHEAHVQSHHLDGYRIALPECDIYVTHGGCSVYVDSDPPIRFGGRFVSAFSTPMDRTDGELLFSYWVKSFGDKDLNNTLLFKTPS